MKSIIFIAPPAAGKGTQSKIMTDRYGIPHISTGDLLREAASKNDERGKFISDQMATGGLVSDDVILSLLEERLSQNDCNNGYILDGFPRNVDQAVAYEGILNKLNKELGYVICIDIDKEVAMERIVGRISCPKCGAVYNKYSKEACPTNEGLCDKCHVELTSRSDDNEETFNKRFDTYLEKTAPLIEYYTNKGVLSHVDGNYGKYYTDERVEEIINGRL